MAGVMQESGVRNQESRDALAEREHAAYFQSHFCIGAIKLWRVKSKCSGVSVTNPFSSSLKSVASSPVGVGGPGLRRAVIVCVPSGLTGVERDAVATTQADGTVWIFGGLGPDGAVSGRHEGYDPAIDSWKAGDNLPVPVQHAMSVTWQGYSCRSVSM